MKKEQINRRLDDVLIDIDLIKIVALNHTILLLQQIESKNIPVFKPMAQGLLGIIKGAKQ